MPISNLKPFRTLKCLARANRNLQSTPSSDNNFPSDFLKISFLCLVAEKKKAHTQSQNSDLERLQALSGVLLSVNQTEITKCDCTSIFPPLSLFLAQNYKISAFFPEMHFCLIPAIIRAHRICKRFLFSARFSSTCALKVEEEYSDGDTHVCDYAELKGRMQNSATSGDFNQALYTLKSMWNIPGKPTVYDFNALMYCYFKSKDASVHELVKLYQTMKNFGPSPNALTFNTLLNGMISTGILKDAVFIVEEMRGSGLTPSFQIMSKLLRKFLSLKTLVESVGMLDIMLTLGYLPTEPTFNMLICMLSKSGMIREAYFVFSALLSRGCYFGVYTFNPIVWALCKSNQSYTALQLIYLMRKRGVLPNTCSYSALVYGFSREHFWEDAFRCLEEMQGAGCNPNVITYTALIKFLCDDGRLKQALALLDIMETEGCAPDLVTYNVILRQQCYQGEVSDSDLLQFIHQKGFSPDSYTFAALAGGLLKRGKVGNAYHLLDDAISMGHSVDVVIYNIYFHCLCLQSRSKEALALLDGMIREGFLPSIVSYNTILAGLHRENRIDEMFKLFNCFKGGMQPDVVSFTILSAAFERGNSLMIQRILNLFKYEDILWDAVGLNFLVQIFCKDGSFSICLKLLDYMLDNGLRPTIVTINMVLDQLCKNGFLEKAWQLFKHVGDSGILPNVTSYNILILASTRGKNYPPVCWSRACMTKD